MTNLAKRLWPDTVASRAILILVAALLAFHLLGYWAYRVGVENLATANQDRGLAERIVSIKRAIASLPPDFRQLILLRHRVHRRYDEIARITDLPLGTVKNRIFRAREMLRSRLADVLPDEV